MENRLDSAIVTAPPACTVKPPEGTSALVTWMSPAADVLTSAGVPGGTARPLFSATSAVTTALPSGWAGKGAEAAPGGTSDRQSS
jgi:hypothetical protein